MLDAAERTCGAAPRTTSSILQSDHQENVFMSQRRLSRAARRSVAGIAIALLGTGVVLADAADKPPQESGGGRYTFSWPFEHGDTLVPRGGTTKGPPVQRVSEPSEAFQRLQADGLSDFERDRRAILAMAGGYRVSFDFLEVVGYPADYEPVPPYQSWGTEYVYVLEDDGERISLQHLLVMRIVDDEGNVRGPFVNKHWRQDWHYQAELAHRYVGVNTWAREARSAAERKGQWLQTVWQVDDSPRYAAWGAWRHEAEYSTWQGGKTWRPLPRREYSVRDDYDALVGYNRHTVLPTGWVHEQRNEKVVVTAPETIDARLAKEYGVARYERIQDYDFSEGDAYFKATAAFWKLVRDYWDQLLSDNRVVHLKAQSDQASLFMPLFRRAGEIADGASFSDAENRQFVRDTVNGYLADAPEKGAGY